MAEWYRPYNLETLREPLPEMRLAPGAHEAFELFRDHGVTTAIVSLTWDFAVEHFAEELGADYYVGTTLHPDGDITHFLSEDKPRWVRDLANELGIGMEQVLSVGDTSSDVPMLNATGHAVFVGPEAPEGADGVRHVPDVDIHELATDTLDVT